MDQRGGHMTDPRDAPFGAVLLADVVRATDLDPGYPDATDGEGAGARDFHLVRRHFDIRAFGALAPVLEGWGEASSTNH
jgi:hypothetical protein